MKIKEKKFMFKMSLLSGIVAAVLVVLIQKVSYMVNDSFIGKEALGNPIFLTISFIVLALVFWGIDKLIIEDVS